MRIQTQWAYRHRARPDDPALPLINIAFLLLVFFLLAGSLVPPSPFALADLELAQAEPGPAGFDGLAVARDGRLAYRGNLVGRDEITAELFVDQQGPLSVQVDAGADAQFVVDLLRRLARAGITDVQLIGVGPTAL